ncbi:uncharacterized protein L969DRAFT_84045 [Mixia osmundae IAM 14324]|uniref:1-phosphatidylinositol-3-phosphate 5-kinase n=1 Tax=Mixia osmundae (strain CBS 9802 / IAM 14324 / JCM 22182 / KY 12970) TaxID=764103 RepID=G7E021_MIXOS|nr:uncharacterized protein L969DRAFT_84045 [Mixia osmundae IAM 14324]KEI42174.1 hypothetical protein L969DRAFT_84045 [Mixia osmundae IAM 14324]GAA96181.1 hypothetical protein E5Q_02845 [Mixia osmundae IAM 14324]
MPSIASWHDLGADSSLRDAGSLSSFPLVDNDLAGSSSQHGRNAESTGLMGIIKKVRDSLAIPGSSSANAAPSSIQSPPKVTFAQTYKRSPLGRSPQRASSTRTGVFDRRIDGKSSVDARSETASTDSYGTHERQDSNEPVSEGASSAAGSQRLPSRQPGARPFKVSTTVPPTVRLTRANSSRVELTPTSPRKSHRSKPSTASLPSLMTGSDHLSASEPSLYSPGLNEARLTGANLATIPGFPLSQELLLDDARSISSAQNVPATYGISEPLGVTQVFRKLRGEGLSREYWMADESSKECYDCGTVFTSWRRKHHCRICGQIFCSRCASNVISGERYGHDSLIRVCNLCVGIMQDRSDSQTALATSQSQFGPLSLTNMQSVESPPQQDIDKLRNVTISEPLEASLKGPQSQFAASTLFPRSQFTRLGHDSSDGSAIQRSFTFSAKRTSSAGSDYTAETSVSDEQYSDTPTNLNGSPDISRASNMAVNGDGAEAPAPFRQDLALEDRIADMPRNNTIDSSLASYFGDTEAISRIGPESNPSNSPDIAGADARKQSVEYHTDLASEPRTPLAVDKSDHTANIKERRTPSKSIKTRPRGNSRAIDLSASADFSEPSHSHSGGGNSPALYRSRRGSGNPDLLDTSRQHVRDMLQQCVDRANLPLAASWKTQLLPILTCIADDLRPNVRAGDHMDARKYLKIKRIAGGLPSASEYVHGVVFRKSLLHKKMPHYYRNPRIMLLAFPLEYHRVENQLMSLEPLIKQEKEYLRNLVSRILAQRPHIILVEKNVSSIALQYLVEAGVAVARNIKSSVIEAVARCTSADVVSSIDKLALEPRLGRCAEFRVETFEHALLPGRRRTFIRFEGCTKEAGGTILLRGGDMETLAKVKSILRLMALVVFSAKLETYFLFDEHASYNNLQPGPPMDLQPLSKSALISREPTLAQDEKADVSREIVRALAPYNTTALSASAHLRFPAPYPLRRLAEDDAKLAVLRQDASLDNPGFDTLNAKNGQLTLPARKIDSSEFFSDKSTPVISGRIASEISEAEQRHADRVKAYNSFICRPATLDPSRYQSIVYLYTLVNVHAGDSCVGPVLRTIDFYQDSDKTLGQYLEDLVLASAQPCSNKFCGKPMVMHGQNYIHGNFRLSILQERYACPVPGAEDRVIMWSYCKKCSAPTAYKIMSDQTWSLSFGKYLELAFYHDHLTCRSDRCQHNVHRDHVRYFALKHWAFRVHIDSIQVNEVVTPPLRIAVRLDTRLALKDEEYSSIQKKIKAFFDSVAIRTKSFDYGLIASEKRDTAALDLAALSRKAEAERADIEGILKTTYEESGASAGMSLNIVRQLLQNKVIALEGDFAAFEQKFLPASEKDIRRLTGIQLRRLFVDSSVPASPNQRSPVASVTSSGSMQAMAQEAATSLASVVAQTLMEEPAEQTVFEQFGNDTAELPDQPIAKPKAMDLLAPAPPDSRSLLSPSLSQVYLRPMAHGEETSDAASDSDSPERAQRSYRPRLSPSLKVADAVRRFDSHDHTSSDQAARIGSEPPSRPPMRRGKTEQARPKPAAKLGHDTAAAGSEDELRPKRSGLLRRELRRSGSKSAVTRSPASSPTHASIERATLSRSETIKTPALSRHGSGVTIRTKRSSIPPATRTSSQRSTGADSDSLSIVPRVATIGRAPSPAALSSRPAAVAASRQLSINPIGASYKPKRAVSSAIASSTNNSRVAAITEHFDRLSEQTQRERMKRLSASRGRRARPVATAKPVLEVFSNVRDAAKDDSDDEYDDEHSSGGADDEFDKDDTHEAEDEPEAADAVGGPVGDAQTETASLEATSMLSTGDEKSPKKQSALLAQHDSLNPPHVFSESEMSSTGTERSFMKTLSNLWSYRASEFTALEHPMLPTEHIFDNNPVIVREDEPSSIIAFFLSSRSYKDKIKEVVSSRSATRQDTKSSNDIENKALDRDPTWLLRDSQPDGADPEDIARPPAKHFRLQDVDGALTFYCKIFYADQFHALRRSCQCEDTIIESLSRCVKWDASGGKSGSAFLKTRDDRFVVKEISRLEMDALLKFAPAYFDYIAKSFVSDHPSILAKMLGFFRIGFKNPTTGKSMRLDVLVLENLFYHRQTDKIFDLKGSMRNRLITATGKTNEVLLDENFARMVRNSPVYLREHSKKLLRTALFNDSLFLSKMNIMDYSLIVGLDSERNELIVGIVDYVRTYTWTARVETWAKESTLLGGGGKEPTVVTPKSYKARFRSQLEAYFLLSPDNWYTETTDALSEPNN